MSSPGRLTGLGQMLCNGTLGRATPARATLSDEAHDLLGNHCSVSICATIHRSCSEHARRRRFGRNARSQACLSARVARQVFAPPLRAISRHIIDGGPPRLRAIARRSRSAAIPREISSRSPLQAPEKLYALLTAQCRHGPIQSAERRPWSCAPVLVRLMKCPGLASIVPKARPLFCGKPDP